MKHAPSAIARERTKHLLNLYASGERSVRDLLAKAYEAGIADAAKVMDKRSTPPPSEGRADDGFNRGVLIAVSTLINCWGAGTETAYLLAMINADKAMVERMGFTDYDREPLLAALATTPSAEG
jgi:hypothetical protein